MSNLIVANINVRQDSEGRYCLNDLHKAAGGEAKHTPGRFTITENYQGLLTELSRNQDNPVISKRGLGTFVVKELVYAYAMWISPEFHLKVIRAYDNLQTQGIAIAEHAAANMLENPLVYFERMLEQAKQLEAAKRIAESQRDMAVKTIAKVNRTLHEVCRKFPNLNLNKTKADLMNLGYLYRSEDGVYYVYRHFNNFFKEKFIEEKGWNVISPTEEGIRLLLSLYVRGKLTLKKGFTPENLMTV